MSLGYLIIAALILHFVGDFVFQTDRMALNKSTSNKALLNHVWVYSLVLLPFAVQSVLFVLVNGVCHFFTDYLTSRATSYYWKAEMRHEFFVMIGFDQLIHAVTLILTLMLFI